MKKYIFLFSVSFLFCISSQAQVKYGHVNFGNILQLMPQIDNAADELKTYNDSLYSAYDVKMKAFEEKYAALQAKIAEGKMAPVEIQEKREALQQDQQALILEQSQIEALIQKKRSELMAPIVKKVNDAIHKVGKEGNYKMVFDTSLGAILFAADAQNLNDKVKKLLGIKSTESQE